MRLGGKRMSKSQGGVSPNEEELSVGDGNLNKDGPYLPGFPVITYGLEAYVLPTVAS